MARDTRERILDAATRLFAVSDSTGASLRAIARAAGVNSALIHYHFGSREGLFEAAILRALQPIQQRRRSQLETLRGQSDLTGDDLARLFVLPLLPDPDQDPDRAAIELRLLARAFSDHCALVQDLTLKHFGSLLYGFADVLGTALTTLPVDVKQRRMRLCVLTAIETLSGPEREQARAEGPEAERALVRELIVFLAGALEAPRPED
jgi:AcrR family transcriptional regulator